MPIPLSLPGTRVIHRLAFALCAATATLGTLGQVSRAQMVQFDNNPLAAARAQHVSFDAEAVSVTAGKPDWIELRFHITPGYHINSHDPKDELLIPTELKLLPSPSIRLLSDKYPAGVPLRLSIGSGETLSAYTGDLLIHVQVLAQRGQTTLDGTLHYQACDASSCFPPRDLPVSVPLTAQ